MSSNWFNDLQEELEKDINEEVPDVSPESHSESDSDERERSPIRYQQTPLPNQSQLYPPPPNNDRRTSKFDIKPNQMIDDDSFPPNNQQRKQYQPQYGQKDSKDSNGKYPPSNTQYSHSKTQYPPSNMQYPPSTMQYPPTNMQYPPIMPQYPPNTQYQPSFGFPQRQPPPPPPKDEVKQSIRPPQTPPGSPRRVEAKPKHPERIKENKITKELNKFVYHYVKQKLESGILKSKSEVHKHYEIISKKILEKEKNSKEITKDTPIKIKNYVNKYFEKK